MSNEEYKLTANGSWAINWGSNGKQDGPNFSPLSKPGFYNVTWSELNPSKPDFKFVGADTTSRVTARFVCENGTTTVGVSVYIVGNIPELGSWNPENAIKLEPNGPYPTWTGTISNLPPSTTIEWKCIKRQEVGNKQVIQWKSGVNNTFTTPASGSAGDQKCAF